MWQEIFNLAINNGLWAVLFLVLLFYVLRDSRAREKKYQETIDKLGTAISTVEDIKEDVQEIKDIIHTTTHRDIKKAKQEVVDEKMQVLHISDVLDSIFELLRKCNKYIDDTTPWILAKDETKKGRLSTVLYNLLECIRISAILLKPFIPTTSDKILYQLNTKVCDYESSKQFGGLENNIELNNPEPLFMRIDMTNIE